MIQNRGLDQTVFIASAFSEMQVARIASPWMFFLHRTLFTPSRSPVHFWLQTGPSGGHNKAFGFKIPMAVGTGAPWQANELDPKPKITHWILNLI